MKRFIKSTIDNNIYKVDDPSNVAEIRGAIYMILRDKYHWSYYKCDLVESSLKYARSIDEDDITYALNTAYPEDKVPEKVSAKHQRMAHTMMQIMELV